MAAPGPVLDGLHHWVAGPRAAMRCTSIKGQWWSTLRPMMYVAPKSTASYDHLNRRLGAAEAVRFLMDIKPRNDIANPGRERMLLGL